MFQIENMGSWQIWLSKPEFKWVPAVLPIQSATAGFLLVCDLRDTVLVQCVQGSVAVLGSGSLVHVPEALHGRNVPLDTLLGEVELWHKCQHSPIVTTEQHGATVVALETLNIFTVSFFNYCAFPHVNMYSINGLFLPQLLDCSLKQKWHWGAEGTPSSAVKD